MGALLHTVGACPVCRADLQGIDVADHVVIHLQRPTALEEEQVEHFLDDKKRGGREGGREGGHV